MHIPIKYIFFRSCFDRLCFIPPLGCILLQKHFASDSFTYYVGEISIVGISTPCLMMLGFLKHQYNYEGKCIELVREDFD